MKKRILALVLIAVMAIGLVGCKGKKEEAAAETFSSAMKNVQDIESYEFAYDMSFKGTGDTFASFPGVDVKMNGVVESTDPMLANYEVSYKLTDATEYTALTNFVIKDADIYINLKALKTSLTALNDPTIASVLPMIPDEKEYLLINQEGIAAIGALAGTAVPETNVADVEGVTLASTHFIKYFEDVVKDVEPKVISVDGTKVNITVNMENAKGVIDAMLKTDMEKAIDSYVKAGEKLDDSTIVTQVKENKQEILDTVKGALTQAQEGIKTSTAKAEFTMTMDTTGKKGDRKVTEDAKISVAQDAESIEFTLNGTMTEKITDGKKVTVPTSIITVAEIMSTIMGQ